MTVDKTPRPYMSKLFGKYEVVFRPLRLERGREILEVYVESPLDDMKGAWFELMSNRVIENKGYSRVELLDILNILNDLRDLIYVEARNAGRV